MYKLFSSSGVRTFNLASELEVECFAKDGFRVTDIIVSNVVIGKFIIQLTVTSIITITPTTTS